MGVGFPPWARATCALLVAGLLSGCWPFGGGYPTQPCYPDGSDLAAPPPPPPVTAKDGVGPIDLYFDASESMAGYIRGSHGDVRPLQDLVSMTVGPSAQLGDHVQVALFGAGITRVKPDDITRLAQEAPYVCRKSEDPSCDNVQTHIDAVLNAIARSPPDRLSVIVTDLWLTNNDLIGSREVALGAPIRRIFAGGRSVIVLGVRAPYSGKIYDMPDGPPPPDFVGDRPLFLVLAGPLARAQQFRELLMRQQSPSFTPERVRASVFTAETPRGIPAPPLAGPATKALASRVVLDPHYRLTMPQLELRPADALRRKPGETAWTAEVRTDNVIPRDWVWRGPLAGRARLWMLTSPGALKACKAKGAIAWRPVGELKSAWSIASPDQATMAIDPTAGEFARLPPGRHYLMVAELDRGPMQHPNPATQWMREWSFEDVQAPGLRVRPPDVFPTYKLAETAALLEAGLEDAERTDNHPLVSVPVLVKVTR